VKRLSSDENIVETPILVIAFNRPDHLKVLIDRLREVSPTRLFIAIDGPRPDHSDDVKRVQACQVLVGSIDWDCDVHTLFRETNLGCGVGVSTAITWFFEHNDFGIILEDDIIPQLSFFPYCAELLGRYMNDDRVLAISGCNFVPPAFQSRPADPYRFSRVPHIWGWATWRRSWKTYQLDIAGWPRKLPPHRLLSRSGWSVAGAAYWASTFELLARKQIDTWDGQLVLAGMAADRWTATSNVNLIRNIGFGSEATHTLVDRNELQPVGELSMPLPGVRVAVDAKADKWTRVHHFKASWRGILHQGHTYFKRYGRRS
jgi:hypothetical protein